MRSSFLSLGLGTLVLAMASSAPAAETNAAAPAVEGSVIVAKPGGDALLLWDCTPRVVELIKAKMANPEIMTHLEVEAVAALQANAANLAADAKSASVRVIYQRIGAVSPAYGTATTLGYERLAVVTVKPPSAAKTPSALKDVAAGKLPAGVTVDVTGALPAH